MNSRASGRRVKLERKPMEASDFFWSHVANRLVSREDIVKKLWRSDLFIDTERNVNNIVRKIRNRAGRTIPRSRGFWRPWSGRDIDSSARCG